MFERKPYLSTLAHGLKPKKYFDVQCTPSYFFDLISCTTALLFLLYFVGEVINYTNCIFFMQFNFL
jgi:hypothetical protein